MEEDIVSNEPNEAEDKIQNITYSQDKDFYRGMSGELRFKAEGLFKKAKEKGISIEEIDIKTMNTGHIDFPGIGEIGLPAFLVKVKGRDIQSCQVIMDGKQIDYYNRYQGYVAEKLYSKNLVRDERGKMIKDSGKPVVKNETELFLTEWERFEIGKNLVDDKEFGLEKTITGACDRVIRKLMGENDWLYPEEARLLDEEYNTVQNKIAAEQDNRSSTVTSHVKKATDRQINYFKVRVKNFGLDPDSSLVMAEILKQGGFEGRDINDLTTVDMSRLIDGVNAIINKVKSELAVKTNAPVLLQTDFTEPGGGVRQ